MMKRLSAVCAVLACVLLVPFSVQSADYPKMTIMGATANPPDSQHVYALEAFKKVVEGESKGAITVKLFLSGSMGDEQTNVKQLRTGELHVASVFSGNMSPFAPVLNLFGLPYLFPSPGDAEKLLGNKGFMDKINDTVAKQSGARPLCWLMGGYRVLTNSKHRVKNINDLQDLKIRVSPTETQLEAFRSWGVSPHPMAWAEVFSALQQKVVDGQENPFFAIPDNKFWEVQKYITEIHYMFWTGIIAVSDAWYKKQNPATRALIDKGMAEAQKAEWEWVQKKEAKSKEQSIQRGMIVDKLEDEPVWVEKARAIWPKFYAKVGGKEIVDEAVAIIGKK
ncbi:MAG: TRAP transporter substrate-binding protein [Candidatus Methylomirabilota bacterium]